MRPVMGNALVARLAASAFEAGIPILLSTPAHELIVGGAGFVGALLEGPHGTVRVTARRGVVLACGGFPQDHARRQRVYPHRPSPDEHLSNAIAGATGDGISLAEGVGGAFEDGLPNPAIWYPTSRVAYPDGSVGHLAHLLERGKPGVIAVTPDGMRFANEALNYHSFVQELLKTRREGRAAVAYYVCDHRALRRYGLGAARPWPLPFRHYLRTGYLKRGRNIRELAAAAGIDVHGLDRTVVVYNAGARAGRDTEFGKGENAYDRSQGDPRWQPNPCVGPARPATLLCCRDPTRRPRHLRRSQHRRRGAGAGPDRCADPRPLRGGQRPSQRLWRGLSGRRRDHRPGVDLRLYRRTHPRRRQLTGPRGLRPTAAWVAPCAWTWFRSAPLPWKDIVPRLASAGARPAWSWPPGDGAGATMGTMRTACWPATFDVLKARSGRVCRLIVQKRPSFWSGHLMNI